MAGFPDIRLYKSDYTAAEAKNISQEKGSIVFSTKTKRLYVAKHQFGADIQDILWKSDVENKKYTLEIQKVDSTQNFSIIWNDNEKAGYVKKDGKTSKFASINVDVTNIKLNKDVKAKSTVTQKDEVILHKGDNLQKAVEVLARQFEKNFVWMEWNDNEN